MSVVAANCPYCGVGPGSYHDPHCSLAEWKPKSDDPAPVQPIDFSKIRVGDKVRLGGEFEVTEVMTQAVYVSLGEGRVLFVTPEVYAAHIPASRPIEVGKPVLCKTIGKRGMLLAVADNLAWYAPDSGEKPFTVDADDLESA